MSAPDSLPPAYAPFLPVLALLSRPLADVLCGQLIQFEPLARGLEQREFAEQGEFEGLGGLTLHGEIDHILQSELLLRTEAPLEFLRRLAESETLYHDRIYADPGTRPVWRVVLSAGPDILGHGRLVALAALFFLARVAAKRGAAFHWCFLPRAEGAVWFTDISVNSIKRFLRSGAFREVHDEDLADARAVWAEATGERPRPKSPEVADWVIGSARDWGGEAPAITRQRNALSFILQPPMRDTPREARLTVRRGGHSLHSARIELAPDAKCLSALEKPFPAPVRVRDGGQESHSVAGMPGWEPLYLSAPAGNYRAVRVAYGLLILKVNAAGAQQAHWFLPLPADILLAGIAVRHDQLFVLYHQVQQGEQRLVYFRFELKPGQNHDAPSILSYAVPSQHLFDNRSPYALPSMNSVRDVEFYSTSGQTYVLQAIDRWTWRFSAKYSARRILLSTGADQIAGYMQSGHAFMQVIKRNEGESASYYLPDCTRLPKTFHGIAWAAEKNALACAIQPGQWSVLQSDSHYNHPLSPSALQFQVEPVERVIDAVAKNNGVQAQIWSDAALGGEGVIESCRFSGGRRTRDKATLDLGADAGRIAALLRINGVFWAVACDRQGVPQDLLRYNFKPAHGTSHTERLSLEELCNSAAQLRCTEDM